MEAAPLTRAHAHASKATHQQTLHNFKLASQEHKDAAEEFGKAEQETEDPEALRTLALLQQHHRDLSSRLLASTVQTPPTPPPNQTSFSTKDSTMAKPVTTNATTFSPPTSPKHRPPPLFGPDSGKPESPQSDKPKMFFQPSTPTTPSTSDNPTHPSGTRKVAPPPIPLPSPTTITTQTLTYTSMRDGPVLPSPNPFQLAHELANARGIRSPVRGRSPANAGAGVDRNFLQVREPEPGARAASAGGTVRGTSPVLLNAPPRKERRKSASATSPVVGPREALPFDAFKGPAIGEGPIRPAVKEYDSSSTRGASPNPPKLDMAFTKFYSQFEEYIEAVGNPLAYAGLPLDGDMSSMDPALRKAVADKGATESFYVVPTTGGTMSYAGILTRNQQQQQTSSSEKSEPAAVPATTAQKPADKSVNTKTREELEFENTQLRQLTDMMAHKLHTWETSAKVNAAKMRESLQVLKETSHSSPVAEETDRGFGKLRMGGRSPLKLNSGGGKTETQVLTLPDRQTESELPPTPRLAPRTLTLPGRGPVDEYEPPKTPRFGSGFPKDFDDEKPGKSGRALSPNPGGKRGVSPLPGSSKPRALSPAPSVLSENPTFDELQAEVARLRQHETKILKENDKLKTVVGKYRDRWEKLKEGARARRAEQEAGEDGEIVKGEAPDAAKNKTTEA
ncbi:hypothetical protein TWF730_003225 [Orbilia blumenaviensis]|uniref:Uncharacterized protein n=1 Tax=Orbilia blumenaviensis TaxID=1796055 RepID=A0AAV9U513_9PEZI